MAIERLSKTLYNPEQMQLDKEYVAKKLSITIKKFDGIINGPNKTPTDYKNSI